MSYFHHAGLYDSSSASVFSCGSPGTYPCELMTFYSERFKRTFSVRPWPGCLGERPLYFSDIERRRKAQSGTVVPNYPCRFSAQGECEGLKIRIDCNKPACERKTTRAKTTCGKRKVRLELTGYMYDEGGCGGGCGGCCESDVEDYG